MFAALGCIAKLLTVDLIPLLLPLILQRMKHTDRDVRFASCSALITIFNLDPSSLVDSSDTIQSVFSLIGDKDISIMHAVVCLLNKMYSTCQKNLSEELVEDIPNVASIIARLLHNTACGKLTATDTSMIYHGVPAPWLQIECLKLLKLLSYWDSSFGVVFIIQQFSL